MINLEALKQLRNETGVSFSVCKKAIEEAQGDIEQAKKLLAKWGEKKVSDKASRTTDNGTIAAYTHHNGRLVAVVALKSETDFVGSNTEFRELARQIAMQVATMNPSTVEELMAQEYIRDTSKKISELIRDAVLRFGENIKIESIHRFTL